MTDHRIYKYPIAITDDQDIYAPVGSTVVHAGLDPQGQACLWLWVDLEVDSALHHVQVIGTGHPTNGLRGSHAGSFVQGPFVWHVFFEHVFPPDLP